MTARILVCALAVVGVVRPAAAQNREPIGRFVVDVRGASAGLPVDAGWTPTRLPTSTTVPSRGLGLEVGGHLYVLRFGGAALGVGATWLTARGTAAPPVTERTDRTVEPAMTPEVTTRLTSLAPQVSINFGHSLGWSYLSAGLGRVRVESEAAPLGRVTFVPLESGWVKSLNFGGGARWFMTDRVGVGFDLRWHKLSLVAASATHPGAPRASLLVAGAGVVLK